MQISHTSSIAAAALLCLVVTSAPLRAQTRDKSSDSNPAIATLASGWSALAAGRRADAIKAADTVLTRSPGRHAALDLKIEALSESDPVKALDAYEAWLARVRIEDVFLLSSVAQGTLEQIASNQDPVLRSQALQRLAQSGDARAAAQLQELAKSGSGTNDLQLALAGDAAAAGRLLKATKTESLPPQSLAKALPAAGAAAVPALRALLKHPAAPVRMEGALSLGKLGSADAIPDLKPLLNDPELRSYAAVALTRLGDADAEIVVQELLQSPVYDVRLLAAQAYDGKGPGPWVQALMPALQDPNGLTRIRAAELLAPVAPEAARPVLMDAAKDPNPVVRGEVIRVLEETRLLAPAAGSEAAVEDSPGSLAPAGLATLRRLLRDPDPATRLHAAGVILAIVRGAR
jgi:HEAT repeat protein